MCSSNHSSNMLIANARHYHSTAVDLLLIQSETLYHISYEPLHIKFEGKALSSDLVLQQQSKPHPIDKD